MAVKTQTTIADLRAFNYDKTRKELSAYISDLNGTRFGKTLRIKSHVTQKVVEFILVSQDTQQGETVGWWFRPCKPLATVEKVLIIND